MAASPQIVTMAWTVVQREQDKHGLQLPLKRSARERALQQRLEEMLRLALGFALLGANLS